MSDPRSIRLVWQASTEKVIMPWVIAVLVLAGLTALAVLFVLNARTIRRDLTTRTNAFQRRLESHATSIVNDLFNADR